MIDNKMKIKDYGYDVSQVLDVSPFEYIDTFACRSYLTDIFYSLDDEDKAILKEYDKKLLLRAEEFYNYLKPIYRWGSSEKPYTHWWWHLDKVISGELNVDIEQWKVEINGETMSI
ncbi:hypothetical protein [Acetivibrio saccincola]|jgi:hypothetical protein|uniref:Uncharacterized protein n=1 Tax=Acetivibrio saccincola TaxID=1677857 RepID=A0A2K9E6N4_9FIRM|nr:hypothetical protein [Acetivibrio saccincola]AUG57136.1 hypothetical protein HVS_06040 [Acetivibrio saccincola]AUG58868.1 hypothetical protein HVS_15095 [Acetivibrio saccincola]PQQ66042.1 hypothetical protein B9R14_04180 [Acetivibrio saccincola]